MLVLNNIAAGNDWTDAAAVGPLPNGGSVSYLVANNAAFLQLNYGRELNPTGYGTTSWGPEQLVGPSQGGFDRCTGIRFRNAVAGATARIFAVLYEQHDPRALGSQVFTQLVSSSGAFTTPATVQVAARIRNSINQNIASGAPAAVSFDTIDYAVNATKVGNTLVVPTGFAGYYTIGAAGTWAASATIGAWRSLTINVNGAADIAQTRGVIDNSVNPTQSVGATVWFLNGGDVVSLVAEQADGGARVLRGDPWVSPVLWMTAVIQT